MNTQQMRQSTIQLLTIFAGPVGVNIEGYLRVGENLMLSGSLTPKFTNALRNVLEAGLSPTPLSLEDAIQLSNTLRAATVECLQKQLASCAMIEEFRKVVSQGAAKARMKEQFKEK